MMMSSRRLRNLGLKCSLSASITLLFVSSGARRVGRARFPETDMREPVDEFSPMLEVSTIIVFLKFDLCVPCRQ